MDECIKLSVIYASTREGRLCEYVGRWLAEQIEAVPAYVLDVIDPAQLDLPTRHLRNEDESLQALRQRLSWADAFIIVTPEYNHGYPAAVKFLIDAVYEPWHGKPVAFVSYGGQSGGLRAVEQLRQVFAELHTVTLRDTVALVNAWEQFDADGRLRAPARPRQALKTLLSRLDWWARALRAARAASPYRQSFA